VGCWQAAKSLFFKHLTGQFATSAGWADPPWAFLTFFGLSETGLTHIIQTPRRKAVGQRQSVCADG
jgi:hypothetical protein